MICLTFCIPTCTKAFGKSNFIYCNPEIYFAFELVQVELFLGTTHGEAEFWMLALVQQLIALVKNTGVLDKAKEKVKQCLGRQALDEERAREAASKRVIKAASDNFGELVTPIVLGIALAAETRTQSAAREPSTTRASSGTGARTSTCRRRRVFLVTICAASSCTSGRVGGYLSKKNSQRSADGVNEETADKPRKGVATENGKPCSSRSATAAYTGNGLRGHFGQRHSRGAGVRGTSRCSGRTGR